MTFVIGDRIRAKEGVRPGHYGFVTGFDSGYPHTSDTIRVTYDSGFKDHIFGRMLELVSRESRDDFEVDE